MTNVMEINVQTTVSMDLTIRKFTLRGTRFITYEDQPRSDRTQRFHCHGLGSIPGQGTKILQAAWNNRKKKKKGYLKKKTN